MIARLRENLIYKLLALGFAIALHFYATNLVNPHSLRVINVPLTVRNLPADAIWNAKNAPMIAVTVDGPTDDIARLTDSAIEAVADVRQVVPGKSTVSTVTANLSSADNPTVSVTDWQPRVVNITLDPLTSRRVAVLVGDQSPPPAGYAYRLPVVSPDHATVSGSPESVDSVDKLVADVGATAGTGPVDQSCPLVALDSEGNAVPDVVVAPLAVNVHIGMFTLAARKDLYVNADIVGSPAYPYRVSRIDVAPQTITVEGAAADLAEASTVVTAPIDLSQATGDVTKVVACILPAGTSAASSTTVTVTVHVESQPPANSQSPSAPPTQGAIPPA